MTEPLSAIILTRNEESVIERSLESVAWVDEIVVVDALSTDNTKSIATANNRPWSGKVSFFEREWSGFRDQRNFSLEKAQNNWVFVLDADEACSPELKIKIQEILSSPAPAAKAFKTRRIEYFLGKPIKHGVWNPSYQDRFFYKQGVQYINEIHEYPLFPKPALLIHEPIHHYPEFNIEKFLDKMNRYTSVEARDRVSRGQRTNLIHLLFAAPAMILKNYFYYGAYKDGIHGLIISILEGLSRAVRHVKIWQYTRNQK